MKTGHKFRGRLVLIAVMLTSAAAAVGGAYSATVGHATRTVPRDDGPRPAIGRIPPDVNGDGIISDQGAERIPSLIAAAGDHGVSGYVKYSDLYGTSAPASPAVALATQSKTREIPVYGADGVTIVGTLTAAPARNVIEKVAAQATKNP